MELCGQAALSRPNLSFWWVLSSAWSTTESLIRYNANMYMVIKHMEIELYQKNPDIVPDERDAEIARELLEAFDKDKEPRVGDFVIMPGGAIERFSQKWPNGLQTTDGRFGASFHLMHGYASFSGGLNPTVPNEKLIELVDRRMGDFWFFHHDQSGAHRGVGVKIPCRVYVVVK